MAAPVSPWGVRSYMLKARWGLIFKEEIAYYYPSPITFDDHFPPWPSSSPYAAPSSHPITTMSCLGRQRAPSADLRLMTRMNPGGAGWCPIHPLLPDVASWGWPWWRMVWPCPQLLLLSQPSESSSFNNQEPPSLDYVNLTTYTGIECRLEISYLVTFLVTIYSLFTSSRTLDLDDVSHLNIILPSRKHDFGINQDVGHRLL